MFAIFVFFLFISIIHAYNLETNVSSVVIRPPRLSSYKNNNANQDGTEVQVEKSLHSNYFGYSLSFQKDSSERNSYRLNVGAPKAFDANHPDLQNSSIYAEGNVLSCPLSFTSPLASCTSVERPGGYLGDAFGLSIGNDPDGNLLACSPLKQEKCRSFAYSAGRCYKQTAYGSQWEEQRAALNESCKPPLIDLIFLLDASGSIGKVNFQRVKDWTKTLCRSFNISDGKVRIGIVRYSHFFASRGLHDQLFINTEIPLGSIRDREVFERAVDKIEVTRFHTYTAHALNKTVADFMSSERFKDPETNKVLILLTDGRSTDGEYLEHSASFVRSFGITTFAVGVGKAKIPELRIVATGRETNERVYYVANFDELSQIVIHISRDIRSSLIEGSSLLANASGNGLFFSQYGFSIHAASGQKRVN